MQAIWITQLGQLESENRDKNKEFEGRQTILIVGSLLEAHHQHVYRCGKTPPHELQVCPARESTCRRCGKKSHFSNGV